MPIWRRVSLQWKVSVIMWTRKHLKVPLKFLSDFDSLSKKRSKLTAYEFDVQNSDEIGKDIFHTDAGVSINPVGSGLPPPGRLPPSAEPASWLVVVVVFFFRPQSLINYRPPQMKKVIETPTNASSIDGSSFTTDTEGSSCFQPGQSPAEIPHVTTK